VNGKRGKSAILLGEAHEEIAYCKNGDDDSADDLETHRISQQRFLTTYPLPRLPAYRSPLAAYRLRFSFRRPHPHSARARHQVDHIGRRLVAFAHDAETG
jgi:hypothetical protein